MIRLYMVPYREQDKRFKLKKNYVVKVEKDKRGNLVIPIPDDIVKAYHIQIGDIAVFEVINKNTFIVRFAKKGMCSFVEKYRK